MNANQTKAVIEFMNEHGAENISIQTWGSNCVDYIAPKNSHTLRVWRKATATDCLEMVYYKGPYRHRVGGPAVIKSSGNNIWCENGTEIKRIGPA